MQSYFAPPSPFHKPSIVYQILSDPIAFTARFLYTALLYLRARPLPQTPPIRVVCISDTHTKRASIPDGDLLIHAGDLAQAGNIDEIQEQIYWLQSLPHQHKVVIAGNHDTYLDPRSRQTLDVKDKTGKIDWGNLHYLQHSTINLSFPLQANRQLRIYGAPQIPACGGPEFAFQYTRHQDAWTETVPTDTDILVTHTPPKWHLDLHGVGCEWLLREIWRVKPRLHVFGHVHAGCGMTLVSWDRGQAAYERICSREHGIVLGLLDPRNWLDVLKIVISGSRELAWSRLWGGEARGCVMVNAALMSQDTGELSNAPQVVLI